MRKFFVFNLLFFSFIVFASKLRAGHDYGISALVGFSEIEDSVIVDQYWPLNMVAHIKNFGTETLQQGEQIVLKVKVGPQTVQYLAIIGQNGFAPGDAVAFSFTSNTSISLPNNLASGTVEKFKVYTEYSGDEDASNDTTERVFQLGGYNLALHQLNAPVQGQQFNVNSSSGTGGFMEFEVNNLAEWGLIRGTNIRFGYSFTSQTRQVNGDFIINAGLISASQPTDNTWVGGARVTINSHQFTYPDMTGEVTFKIWLNMVDDIDRSDDTLSTAITINGTTVGMDEYANDQAALSISFVDNAFKLIGNNSHVGDVEIISAFDNSGKVVGQWRSIDELNQSFRSGQGSWGRLTGLRHFVVLFADRKPIYTSFFVGQ